MNSSFRICDLSLWALGSYCFETSLSGGEPDLPYRWQTLRKTGEIASYSLLFSMPIKEEKKYSRISIDERRQTLDIDEE